MKTTLTLFLIFIFTMTNAQTNKLYVEENAENGTNRVVGVLDNFATGSEANTILQLKSGSGSDLVVGSIAVQNNLYSAIPDLNGYLNITSGSTLNEGRGINFRSAKSYGNFRFYIGGYNNNDLRMILTSDGYLGVGTESPASKLQVSDGDIYIDDINKGVIMKSPNGSCWRLTINNDGTTSTTLISCPF